MPKVIIISTNNIINVKDDKNTQNNNFNLNDINGYEKQLKISWHHWIFMFEYMTIRSYEI